MERTAKGAFLRRLAIISVLAVLGAVIFVLTLFHLIPADMMRSWLDAAVREATGLTVEAGSFVRKFPLGIELAPVRLVDGSGRGVVRLDSLRADLNPLGLVTGLRVDFRGAAGDGNISGSASAGLFSKAAEAEARGVPFAYLEALSAAGVRLDGAFDGVFSIRIIKKGCPRGRVRMEGTGIRGAELEFRGIPLPVDDIDEAGLAAEFGDCRLRLDGVWLEGGSLSARVQGEIRMERPASASPVDLTVELVPGEGLRNKEFVMGLLSRYRKSGNYYSIPVKGTLGSLGLLE